MASLAPAAVLIGGLLDGDARTIAYAIAVALNVGAGLVYGWLFWRRGLEASMASHASTHLGFALARIAL